MELDKLVLPVSAQTDTEAYDELVEDYVNELKEFVKLAEKIPDDAFPSFLFHPIINDFGDNYYTIATASGIQAPNLHRKYPNFYEYLDAIDIWNEYIGALIDKYGSYRILISAAKMGLIPEQVPPKPKLKKSKRNKRLLKSGIIASREIGKMPDNETLLRMSRNMIPVADIDEGINEVESDKPPKDIRKIFKEAAKRRDQAERKRGIYSTRSDAYDAIVDFMRSKNSSYYNKNGTVSDISISAYLKQQREFEFMTEEEIEEALNPKQFKIREGRIVDGEEEARIETYKALYEAGYDLLGKASKTMSKSANRMLLSRVGKGAGPMSKKQLRKIKKKQKKQSERMSRELEADDFIRQTLIENKIDFGSSELSRFAFKDYDDE